MNIIRNPIVRYALMGLVVTALVLTALVVGSPAVRTFAYPSVDTAPYHLPCNFNTNFTSNNQQWLRSWLNEGGYNVAAQHTNDGGFSSPKYQAVLARQQNATYYTLYLAIQGGANMQLVINSGGRVWLNTTAESSAGTLNGGVYRWFNKAYSGSATSGWQQVGGSAHTSPDFVEVCGYTDNVPVYREDGSNTSKTLRKYFPFADGSARMVGAQWHFMESKTDEPVAGGTTGGGSGDSVTQSQLEETLVKISGVWLAIITGLAVIYTFRFRYGS